MKAISKYFKDILASLAEEVAVYEQTLGIG
jgi:hypothetical protein